mgnify:CR=1 FL=1
MTDALSRRAVVLLSGGLDSYTAAAIAQAEGFILFALTIRYGQLHVCELEAARRVARVLGVARHLELEIDLAMFGGSALTGAATAVAPRRSSTTWALRTSTSISRLTRQLRMSRAISLAARTFPSWSIPTRRTTSSRATPMSTRSCANSH